MKKENYIKTTEAITLLSEVLTNYEYGEAHAERMEVLKAFNTLSDLVARPKSVDSAKRINSYMGVFFVYFNVYGELVVLDSNKKQIFFLDNIDIGEELDIYKQLENMKHPRDLYDFDFCAEIDYDNDYENFTKRLTKANAFGTSNPQSEIHRVGLFYLFFVY